MAQFSRETTLVLFDIDGTLTPARQSMAKEMLDCLTRLQEKVTVAVVGGSDRNKQIEQLGEEAVNEMDYAFAENGVVAFKKGVQFHSSSIKEFLGEEKLQELIDFCLRYIADLRIPMKRGTFIEFRTGMLNVSPIGRNCSMDERREFFEYDKTAGIRTKMVKELEKRFKDFNLHFSIGGQISLDIFPKVP